MRKLLTFAAFAVVAAVSANAQFTSTVASTLKDPNDKLVNGTIHFLPRLAVKLATQGQVTMRGANVPVINGAFTVALADTNFTTPASCYVVWVTDPLNRVILGDPSPNVATGYQCVRMAPSWCTSGVCNFDNYVPDGAAGIPNINGIAGVKSVNGRIGDIILTHTDISDWTAATAGFHGGGSGAGYSKTFTGATTVTIGHNLGTALALTQCFDVSNNLIIGAVKIIDNNTVAVTFASSQDGYCVVLGGSAPGSPGSGGDAVTINGAVVPPNLALAGTNSSGQVVAGVAPVTTVATRTGDIHIQHTDVEDWNAATAGFGGSTSTATVREYIDMQDHGAVADGTTDNRGVLNAVLTDIIANANGQNHRVYFPAGTYAISDTIFIPTKTEIYGNKPGDVAAGGTTFVPGAGFPVGHPMFQFGTSSSTVIQRSSLHDMTVACNANAGIGVYEFNAQEQTGIYNMVLFGCGDTGFRIRGSNSCGGIGGCTGYSEHNGPDQNIEVYPDHFGTANTTCFDVENDQQYHGAHNVTCAMGSFTVKPNFGAKLSCNSCSATGLHFENTHNGVALGASTTQGISGAVIYNVDATTGVDGNVVELETNSNNQPYDIHLYGVSGGALPIKNNAYPQYGDSFTSMDIGQQSGGNATVQKGDFNAPWNIYNQIFDWRTINSQLQGNILCSKYDGGSFPNYCIANDSAGDLLFGNGATGAHNSIFNTPYGLVGLNQGGTTLNGLNLGGAIADANNGIQSMVANNLQYNHANGQFTLPGNGSGETDGYVSWNPGGAVPIRSGLGGFGIFAANGLTEGGTGYTAAQFRTSMQNALFPNVGGFMLLGEFRSRPTCNATTRELLWFSFDNANTNDSVTFCGYVGGVLAWNSIGTGTGGGGGGVSSINGQTGAVVLDTLTDGNGTQIVRGGGTVQANVLISPLTTQPTTLTSAHCGGTRLVYTTAATTINIPIPHQGGAGDIYTGCHFEILNASAGNISIAPSGATPVLVINGAVTTSTTTFTVATGKWLSLAVNSDVSYKAIGN